MNRSILTVACGFLVASAVGCASIINEKTQNVNVVTSNGRKAEVNIDGMAFQAPGVASFKRAKADKIITTRDPKCNPTTVAPSNVDNIFFINILSGGVFGSTTDYSTEKMWKYQDTVIISCKD
jgi:hypothetical protein